MVILVSPDSFKGSFSARTVAHRLAVAARRVFPVADIRELPIADGGEGTAETLIAATGGRLFEATVSDPLGRPVCAQWGELGDGETAVIEMAQAVGLPRLSVCERDPMRASSRGLGELIACALDRGYRRLLVGIGGSATNDGGMGLLAALGARFFDANGEVLRDCGASLTKIERIDLDTLHPSLPNCEMKVMCDVVNPLLGSDGATAIYGPQKGATSDMLVALETGMRRYATLLQRQLGRDVARIPGAGAAGGAGAALIGVLGAKSQSGIDAVLEAVDFDRHLAEASLVVTGEGCIDAQSVRFGKGPSGVARRCAERGVPVVAVVGGMGAGAEAFMTLGDASLVTTINAAMPIEDALRDAEALLDGAADRLFRLLRIGTRLTERSPQ